MDGLLSKLEPKEWLELNAKLQQKKNKVRRTLKERGVLKREGSNNYDNYAYFTEAQYKALFTELLSENGLELKCEEEDYIPYEGSEKMPNGRIAKLKFVLFDIETGFFETTMISGEGLDKGDKAGYKAFTGALKYFLANTFMVATGDDAEKESPEAKANPKKGQKLTASDKQIAILKRSYQGENLAKLLAANGLEKIEDLPMSKASELIQKLMERKEK